MSDTKIEAISDGLLGAAALPVTAQEYARRHLTREQQAPYWAALRAQGLSYRQIEEMTGADKSTVCRAIRKAVEEGRFIQPTVIVGNDGKARAAVK